MRQYKDKNGIQVSVESIQGNDAFSGLIEGSAYMARRIRHMRATKDMEQGKGILHWALDDLEKEIATLGKETDLWPTNERWIAFVGTSTYLGPYGEIYRYEKQSLKICWYQECGDPMETLKNIVSEIDFISLCVTQITEEYD